MNTPEIKITSKTPKADLLIYIITNTPTDSLYDLEFDEEDIHRSVAALPSMKRKELYQVAKSVEACTL